MWTLTHTRHVIYIYLYLYGMQIDRKLMMNTWCTASERHKIHTADPQCIELNILDIIRTMMSFDATFKVKWSTFFYGCQKSTVTLGALWELARKSMSSTNFPNLTKTVTNKLWQKRVFHITWNVNFYWLMNSKSRFEMGVASALRFFCLFIFSFCYLNELNRSTITQLNVLFLQMSLCVYSCSVFHSV